MRNASRPRRPAFLARLSLVAATTLGLGAAGAVLGLAASVTASAASPGPAVRMVSLAGSFLGAPAGAKPLGAHARDSQLAIEVVLRPSNEKLMNADLSAMYDPQSPSFHHWLAAGQFAELFAPVKAQVTSVKSYLESRGLTLRAASSPFLIAATGSTSEVEGAFSTAIDDYRSASGTEFFANSQAASVPEPISGAVSGVIGLDDTSSPHPMLVHAQPKPREPAPHYGAGPFGSGLVPSQTRSLYGATKIFDTGVDGQGHGVTAAAFELSGYARSDVEYWLSYYYGPAYTADIVNENVDGGPIHPKCPKDDKCNKGPDYSGDDEVTADIEQQLTIAPDLKKLIVYNAPNDLTGQTAIDEYMRIASDDTASTISTSWGLCEPDEGAGAAQGENIAFTQMAMQGQSIFAASGDNGAWDCLEDGTSNVDKISVDDPGSQPWVTSAGGSSFSGYDPGNDLTPSYPKDVESVWNPLDACNGSKQGLKSCDQYGAGGGGASVFWARGSYQHGPEVNNQYSTKAPTCAFATKGQYCREVPDISVDSDEFTGYSSYCKGIPKTNSSCYYFLKFYPSGWGDAGGTSLSAPFWAALVADATSFHGGQRFGNANEALYSMYRGDAAKFFHDITGKNQTDNNNGLFPTTPGYDLATGIGSPDISAIAMAAYRN
jgi:subtilase family serine protease